MLGKFGVEGPSRMPAATDVFSFESLPLSSGGTDATDGAASDVEPESPIGVCNSAAGVGVPDDFRTELNRCWSDFKPVLALESTLSLASLCVFDAWALC